VALAGVTVTVTGGAMVTPAKPLAVASCIETASTDTVEGVG